MKSALADRMIAIPAVIAALSLGGYLAWSAAFYRIGFPLDDAWIHQTYAYNLGARGEWAFIPGEPSAGSTAPLWSALLAPAHLLGIGPYWLTYVLGWLSLVLTAAVGGVLFRRLRPESGRGVVWVGVFLALEWHLVWSAGSGMETLAAGLPALVMLAALLAPQRNWFLLGVLTGIGVWIRPDMVTLAGPAAWVLVFENRSWKDRLADGGRFLVGMLLPVVPYLGFNRILAGAWWPNTFFAKQAEYAVLREIPLWKRLLGEARLPLIGAGLLLLPGFGLQLVDAIRRRTWGELAGPLWAAGYLGLYALRLPVVYQHGRYIIPMMPVFFVWGLAGAAGWVRLKDSNLPRRVLSRVWILSFIGVTCAFWIAGARAYAADVAIIESEMAAAAKWVAENTPEDSLIAAHDIGALGYFGKRRLLDLAGLVSPEVIPFIRDEARLEAFLDEQRANYLVTFPGWYPQLVTGLEPVYTTADRFSPAMGGENMNIYRLR